MTTVPSYLAGEGASANSSLALGLPTVRISRGSIAGVSIKL